MKIRAFVRPGWLLAATAALGCSSSAETAPSGGDGGAVGGQHAAGGQGGSSSVGGGPLCGGQTCGEQAICDDVGPDCEELTPEESSCHSVPLDCYFPVDTWEPLCLCDGTVRPFDCGFSTKTSLDRCDRIECGAESCDKASEYCEVTVTNIDLDTATYACKPIPPACGSAPSCACMAGEPCGGACAGSAEGGFQLACYETP